MLHDKNPDEFRSIINRVLDFLYCEFGIENDFECCSSGFNGSENQEILEQLIHAKRFIQHDHHLAHAACAFYQSNFKESLIISYDGGGNDGVFNTYFGRKELGLEKLKFSSEINFGHAYMLCAYPISDIKGNKGRLPDDLALAGKMMGLVAYGNIRSEWIPHITEFYKGIDKHNLKKLGKKLKIKTKKNSLSGQVSYDLAATSQKVFEDLFFEEFSKLKDFCVQYNFNYNSICLSGGAALNVLLNQKLLNSLNRNTNLFVPPNPDDGGLSLGQLFLDTKPQSQVEITFHGLPITDKSEFPRYIIERKGKPISYDQLAEFISKKKIVGIINNDSEVGPRALGNRSIVCDPSFSDMKDIINSKVKFREWYRPFAPVCRDVDAWKYFEIDKDLNSSFQYMSFAPLVKSNFRNVLPSICHEDSSTRLQVIKEEFNPTLYAILSCIGQYREGPSVLLNTSFNIKGKPILSSYSDSFEVLDQTKLDAVFSSGYIFEKIDA